MKNTKYPKLNKTFVQKKLQQPLAARRWGKNVTWQCVLPALLITPANNQTSGCKIISQTQPYTLNQKG